MHIAGVWGFVRRYQAVSQSGEQDLAIMESRLRAYGSGESITCGAGTEAGASFLEPRTTATKVEGGWVINGRKIFGTNSEVADGFGVFLRVVTDRSEQIGSAFVPASSEGVEVRRNWDALGMRASCSHEIVFTDCFVPDRLLFPGPPIGTWDTDMLLALIGVNFPLIGAYIGIAEAARDLAVDAAKSPKGGRLRSDSSGVRHLIAEIEIDLCAARAGLARTALAMDDYIEGRPPSEYRLSDIEHLVKDWQCSKLVTLRAATSVVEKAMTVAGGGSYMSANPLSRLWRDVRAGSFHQPCSPVEAYEFIGRMALGMDPLAGL
jgi:alkylation response protein AidB-like acyl-CoA dehydrogenase